MEWLDIATKVGLSGSSLLLAGAVYTLWKKLESKDAKIEELNHKMVEILIDVSTHSDDDSQSRRGR